MIGKYERKYLKNLQINVEDYCEDHFIDSVTTLYNDFGSPDEIVNSYYASVDTQYIVKKINLNKFIKRFLLILLILAVVSTSTYCVTLYHQYKILKEEQIFSEETVIE